MEYVGEYLKSVRVNKKLKLEKISNELRISKSLLTDIENDNFPEYIDTVFLIGHIRSYSKFLNLDDDKLVQNFKIQTSYNISDYNEEISKPVVFSKFLSMPITLSFSSILIISVSFYFLFIKPNEIQIQYAMTPDVPENLLYNLEEIEMNIGLLNKAEKNYDESILENDKQKFLVEQEVDNLVSSSSVVASLPNEIDIKKNLKKITLNFLNPTWIQLRNKDNEIIYSKLMNQGEEYTYSILQNLYLTAGNAGNIIVSIDGVVKGKVGKAGHVVESLIIDTNFLN